MKREAAGAHAEPRPLPEGWRMASLAEATTESVERNNARLNDALLFGVSKSAGLIPMKDRVKGASTDRCKVVRPNAFAYNPMRINIGSIARNETADTLMVSPDYVVFEAQPDCLLPEYLDHFRRTHAWRSFVGAAGDGSVRVRIYYDHLSQLRLPLPPRAEQRKIASILTAVDDKLDVIARQIEATQTLKQGLMQTLFSRGVGTRSSDGTWAPHTHLHHVDGRELPRAWGAATLGAYIAELRAGVSVNAEDRGRRPGEVGVLKVSSVQGGRFLPSNHKTVVPMEVDRVAEPVQEGCIIISRANTPALVGESAYVVESCPELFLPDKLWQTRPTNKAHSTRWLAFYLQSPAVRQEVQKAATGTSGSMKNISKASLLSIFMPLVPLEEQRHIANLLGAFTSKIEALEAKHQHYQTLKRGLTQKLLIGEWSVKVDAEMAA